MSTSSPSSSSPLLATSSSSAPRPVLAVIVQPQPTTLPAPPQLPQGQPVGGLDRVVKPRAPLHRSFTYARKRKLLQEYAAQPHGQKAEWLRRRKLDYPTMSDWKKMLKQWEALPKERRPSLNRRRGPGGGRRKAGTALQVESGNSAPADATAATAPAPAAAAATGAAQVIADSRASAGSGKEADGGDAAASPH